MDGSDCDRHRGPTGVSPSSRARIYPILINSSCHNNNTESPQDGAPHRYGFPPNVGATGTAALLDVPASLDRVLGRLRADGYFLGPNADEASGEALVAALAELSQESYIE